LNFGSAYPNTLDDARIHMGTLDDAFIHMGIPLTLHDVSIY